MNASNKKTNKIRIIGAIVIAAALVVIAGARIFDRAGVFYDKGHQPPAVAPQKNVGEDKNSAALIDSSGFTSETRVITPPGFTRADAVEGSLLEYMRGMELQPDGSPVRLYSGEIIDSRAAAVYSMDVDSLQQCADSVIRIYSEYLYSHGQYDKISFSLTNGTVMDYSEWRSGKRLIALGSFAKCFKLAGNDESYDCFRAYLSAVMNYAGTKSLSEDSEKISAEELAPGDMLLHGGTPGHVALVIDKAVNSENEVCFLLAQGYMPARSFHILNNPKHEDDPWYYASEMTDKIDIGDFIFENDELYRWNEFK